jgi:hypothetical protein
MRLILTAGHPRAEHVLALAELLRRSGAEIFAIVAISPWSLRRARLMLNRRGPRVFIESIQRVLGIGERPRADPLRAFLARNDIAPEPLRFWARRNHVRFLATYDLNDPAVVSLVRHTGPEALVLYGGGGILRKPFIDAAARGVINAHSGPLPHVRGMNACEWSLLLGFTPTVTLHYIDEGIDTGPSISSAPVVLEPGDTVAILRSRCAVIGIRLMLEFLSRRDIPAAPGRSHSTGVTRQSFLLAPVMRELLEHRLKWRLRE